MIPAVIKQPAAFPAHSARSVLTFINVLNGQLMTGDAMSLDGVAGSVRLASQQIGLSSNRFKMIRSDAFTIPAQMIEVETSRNRPDECLINGSMSLPAIEGAVSVTTNSGSPFPAAIANCELACESVEKIHFLS